MNCSFALRDVSLIYEFTPEEPTMIKVDFQFTCLFGLWSTALVDYCSIRRYFLQ